MEHPNVTRTSPVLRNVDIEAMDHARGSARASGYDIQGYFGGHLRKPSPSHFATPLRHTPRAMFYYQLFIL